MQPKLTIQEPPDAIAYSVVTGTVSHSGAAGTITYPGITGTVS